MALSARARFLRGGGIATPLAGLRWSSLATWGGSFPVLGDPIIVRAGTTLIMDVALADADAPGQITVQSGGSIVVDSALNTRLICDGLYINGGSYIAGSASIPHGAYHDIDLCGAMPLVSGNVGGGPLVRGPTFTGTLAGTSTGNNGTTNDNGGFSRGFIVDNGGTVNLYGRPGNQARRLNAHYASGTTLVLDSPVTALAGATVIISPTGFYNASTRTEVKTLAASVTNSTTITINSALGYARWGLLQYATDTGVSLTSDPWTLQSALNPTGMRTNSSLVEGVDNVIDQRAFVCILDRDITISGYDRSGGNTDLATYGFGFHGMSMDLTTTTVLSHVALENYGQKGLLGRYGWHVHRPSYTNSTGPAAYQTTGIRGTNYNPAFAGGANFPAGAMLFDSLTGKGGQNRFFTWHACRGVVVQDSVGYDSAGHTFLEEDGSEEDNTSLRNIAIAPRDPGSTMRLKEHEAQPSGHWIANFNNWHEGLWGVDCPFVGIWNSISPGLYADAAVNGGTARNAYIANPTTASGCVGASANVPIWPSWSKFGTWTNNAGFVCGTFGVRTEGVVTSNAGTVVQAVSQPRTTANGLPAADSACLPLPLRGIIAYKCLQGGYFNFVTTPGYSFARMADVKSHCFAGSTSPSTSPQTAARNDYPLLIRESLNHESHYLSTWPTNAVASYHGDIQHRFVMAWGYSGGVVERLIGNSFKNADALIGRNAVLSCYDLYDDVHEMLSIPTGRWAMYQCNGTWHTPGGNLMNDTTTYNSHYPGAPGTQYNELSLPLWPSGTLVNKGGRACIYDHWGNLSQGPTQAGVPMGTIVYNQPFYTTGLSVTALEENPESCVTTTPFFGFDLKSDDSLPTNRGHWGGALQWTRLDSTGAAIAGATISFRDFIIGEPSTGGGSHFASVPVGGLVYLHNPHVVKNSSVILLEVSKVSYLVQTSYATANDAVTICLDWDGAVVSPQVFCSTVINGNPPGYNSDSIALNQAKVYTSVANLAALQATTSGWNYWQDTANNKIYVRVRPHNHTAIYYYDVGPPENDSLSQTSATNWLVVRP